MEILQVASSFAPAYAYGGPARSAYQICKNLSAIGHDVTVFTTDAYDKESRYDPERHETLSEDFDIYRFRNVSNRLAYDYNICFAPGMALELRDMTKQFDIVHIGEFRTPQAAFAHRYAKRSDVPYVLQTRGAATRTPKRWQKSAFDAIAGSEMMATADRIIATSEREYEMHLKTFPKVNRSRIAYVPNGIDTGTYRNLPMEGRFRDKHRLGTDELVVLFVGRIAEIKGLDLLVRAFDELHEQMAGERDLELYIVGPDHGELSNIHELVDRQGIVEHVHFPGPLFGEEKLEAYVDADLFVLPSRSESFGNVVIEAMACRTPVIVTNQCGVADWIPADAGRTVEVDPEQICAVMNELLREPGERERMSWRGRELVMEEFNWVAIAERLEDVYDSVLSG